MDKLSELENAGCMGLSMRTQIKKTFDSERYKRRNVWLGRGGAWGSKDAVKLHRSTFFTVLNCTQHLLDAHGCEYGAFVNQEIEIAK